jgi:hypothetical protein
MGFPVYRKMGFHHVQNKSIWLRRPPEPNPAKGSVREPREGARGGEASRGGSATGSLPWDAAGRSPRWESDPWDERLFWHPKWPHLRFGLARRGAGFREGLIQLP